MLESGQRDVEAESFEAPPLASLQCRPAPIPISRNRAGDFFNRLPLAIRKRPTLSLGYRGRNRGC